MSGWIVFYNKLNGEELTRITTTGNFAGEIKATIGLLAYNNSINESDIEFKIE